MATEYYTNARSVARLFSFSETWKNIVTTVEEKSSGNFPQRFWMPTKNQNMILAREKKFWRFYVFCIGRLKREKRKLAMRGCKEEEMMKKILENTAETREYLESLPKIYMIACWAGYGVRAFPFAGKYTADGIPFVWDYDDCNGTCDCYCLRKLTDTTTGWIYAWTTSKSRAEEIAAALNEKAGESWRNQ